MNFKSYIQQVIPLVQSKTSKFIFTIFSTNILVSAMGLLGTVLVLRKAEVEIIGIIYPLISLLHFSNQLGDLGINNSFLKLAASSYSESKKKAYQLYRSTLIIKSIIALVLIILGFLFRNILSELIFKTNEHSFYVGIVIFISGMSIIASVFTSFLRIEEKIKLFSLSSFLPNLFKFILLLYFLYMASLNLNNILFAFFIVPIATFLLSFVLSNKSYFSIQSHVKNDFQEIFSHSKWILVSIITVAAMGQSDVLMTRSIAGSDELARLVAGTRLSSVILILAGSLTSILFPKISTMKSKDEMNFLIRKYILLFLPFIVITLVAGLFIAPLIIKLLLGEKYILAISVFQISLLGYCIDLFITPISLVLFKLNQEKSLAIINTIQFLTNIVCNFLLIPNWGADGASLASTIIRVIALFYALFLLYKHKVLYRPR